ncbi:gamma-glutamylcyclotransferase (GGCT)/AIG2-like uncharacterized protein YtfP [Lewinella aquimaris]|uniref:Gamma-glutamylcyclotransferase (GGCT)/AIG2-like uncharacterized protein YtfP n=1 Tax=Neolewinella aquimaris TaxID=1835722 RepID=A0A840E7J3_9BACT|nr:gamma-glutamylcyclotransferase family protein [Neolewinella aquimaris]MBB4079227.1 gamma-glutamylcyclotransferase (GGCT)/AIG2-like uncharacterized protein YtfP [Neolewinella aquimaris]
MSDHPEYLFVYGTLRSDIPSSMSKFLRRRAALVGKATTGGKLVDLGDYPAFVTGSGTARGELYRISPERAEETWELLDAYEGVSGGAGEEYQRTEIDVRVAAGGKFRAQTYAYRKSVGGKPEIPNGDYLPYYRGNSKHQKFTGND